jgi:hypothetical protein
MPGVTFLANKKIDGLKSIGGIFSYIPMVCVKYIVE